MNKIVSTKRTSAIFLAIVLVAGTIALTSPIFMINAQATSDRDKDYDNEKSYGKDRNDKSKKDSKNVNIKKIKCNNINVNLNGVDADIRLPFNHGPLNGVIAEAQAAEEDEGTNSFEKSGSKSNDKKGQSDSVRDSRIVCINNNNNIVAGEEPPEEECAEADDIEACFEEFLLPNEFELLTDALGSSAGLTAEINGQEVTLRSFNDICEAFGGITTWNQIFLALLNIAEELSDPTAPVGISNDLVDCISEAFGIPVPTPPPGG